MHKRMLASLGVLLCTFNGSVRGATIDWTNTSGGAFSDANNWMNRVLPGINDLARFESNGTYSVNLTGNLSLYSDLRFDAASGLVTMNLGTYTYQQTNALYIGYTAGRTPAVLITNGTLNSKVLQLGANLSSGELTLRNARAVVTASGGLGVGLTGTGRLTIADSQSSINATGGSNHIIGNSAGSYGAVTVNGGSLNITGTLYSGYSGSGLLAIQSGGTNFVTGAIYLGNGAGSLGILTMDGPGAYASGGLNMGNSAGSAGEMYLSNGLFFARGETKFCIDGRSLMVLSGGSITQDTGNTYLPHFTGTGVLVMASAESTFYLGGSFLIGQNSSAGRGEIYLSNGTLSVSSLDLGRKSTSVGLMYIYNGTAVVRGTTGSPLVIGNEANSTGLVVIADERALLASYSRDSLLASSGEGTLIISNGTANLKGINIGNNAGSRGRLLIEAGSLIVPSNTLTIGNSGPGSVTLAHPDSYLENINGSANIQLGNSAGNSGYLYVSNGSVALRSMQIGNAGYGYVEIGSATVSVNNLIYIPNTSATGTGTGTLVMVSADSILTTTGATIRVGTRQAGISGSSASLIISNGTLNAGVVDVGQYSDGYLYLGDATIRVFNVGANGIRLAQDGVGTGTLVMAKAGSLIDSPNATLTMGRLTDGFGRLQMSNGVMNVADLVMSLSVKSKGAEAFVGDAQINVSSNIYLVASGAHCSTAMLTMVHANASIIATNGTITMSYGTNTWSSFVISNGSVVADTWIASSSQSNEANSEVRIYAGTVTLTRAVSANYALSMGGQPNATNTTFLADPVARLVVTNGSRMRFGDRGTSHLVVSNGMVDAFDLWIGETMNGQGSVSIYDGTVQVQNMTLAGSGSGVVNLDHPNALLTITTGTLAMAQIGSAITSATARLTLSNGTVRIASVGVTNYIGSYTQTGVCSAVINVLGGTFDASSSTLFIGNRSRANAEFNVSGGTAILGRATLLGYGSTTLALATGTLSMASGALYLGALDSNGTTPGSQSNVLFSGGSLRNLGSFSSGLSITLTNNAPGSGLVTFDIGTNEVRLTGAISGPGKLRKTGSGSLALNGANAYTNSTEVAGGSLAGTGTVHLLNLNGGVLAPGEGTNFVGAMRVGAMNWTNGTYRWDIQNFSGNQWDTLVGTGALTIASGTITIQVASVTGGGLQGMADNYDISAGYACVIASANSISGFNADKFVLDTSLFVNDEGAEWAIGVVGTNLVLTITPPGTSSRLVYWDATNSVAGIANGSGVWIEGSNSWLVGGLAPNVSWDNAARDRALFSYSSGAGPYTVRVDMAVATNSGLIMPSTTANYTYEINGTGILAMVGLSHSFQVERSGASMIVGAPVRATNGPLVKAGPGDVYLTSASVDNDDGWLIKTGRLFVGAGDTRGELGGGLISMVNDGGAALYFNRSSYTVTNPIADGITYFNNNGGGYAWQAGATQNYAVIENYSVVTQESGSLVFTNFLRLGGGNNGGEGPTLVMRGGSISTPLVNVGYTYSTTCRLVVADSGYLSTYQLNVGYANTWQTAAEMAISNGTVVVERQMYVGRGDGSAPKLLEIAGGTLEFTAGSYLVYSNATWLQTGGSFTNPYPWTGNNMNGLLNLQGGDYYQGGHFIAVATRPPASSYRGAMMIINTGAVVRLVAHSTNFAGATYLNIGGTGGNDETGAVWVTGGTLILTNGWDGYTAGGITRTNNGDICIGRQNQNKGCLRIDSGSVRAFQVWMQGFNFDRVSSGRASGGLGNNNPYGTYTYLQLNGGELYTLRGISNYYGSSAGYSSASNLTFSGGTLGALGADWATSHDITFTNEPGPGVVRMDPNGGLMLLTGALKGPGGLSMDGSGVLVIANDNTPLGGLNYSSNGVLRLVNASGLALGTNLLRVTGGGAVCGTGYVRDLWVGNGGTVSAGECTNVGTLTAGHTVWTNMTYGWNVLDFDGAYGTGWDRFWSTGTLTLAAGSTTTVKLVTLSAAGSFGAAQNFAGGVSYTRLIASAKAISVGAGHTFAVDTSEFMNDEVEASVSVVDVTNIAITVESTGSGNNRPLYWDADRLTAGLQNGTGVWNNAVANWRTEAGNNLAWNNTRQDYAIFGGEAESGSWTVNVSGISSATNIGMSFLSGGSAYTVLGTGYLSFVSGSMITAAAPGTVNVRLEGVGFTKVGAATLTLGGSNQMSGVVTISNGAVRLSDPWALGSSNGATVVASGGELVAAVVAVPTYREPLTLSGSGTNNQGALRFVTGSPTWVGTVTVVGATTRIGADSGVSATLSTVITGGVADVFAGGAGRLLVNGGVQLGSGKIVKDGTGVLSLRGSSAYSGGTIVSAGTLRVCGSCAANVAGTATIRLENGTVLGSESAASTIVNPLSIWGNVQLIDSSLSFNKDLTVTGAVDLNAATRTITVPSAIATLGGAISSGGITKSGAGTLVLGGVNTYASATTLSAGTLVHNGTNASSAVTTSAGTKLLGVGSMAATTVNGEIDPGAALSTVGQLSMASLNLRPSSSIRVTITNATASAGVNQDLINCVGTLTVNATAGSGACVIIPDTLAKTPTGFNTGSAYSWKIISAGGLSGFEVSKFTVSTASFAPSLAGGYFVVTSVGNDVYLKFFPAGEANIRVSVTDAPDPVGLSNSITYSIVVSNLSSVASPDMVLTNYLDSDTTYQSSTHGGSHSAGAVTWNLSSLTAYAFTTLTVVARADIYGAHTNVAHVSTDVADSVPEDNWATNVTEVACVAGNTPVINPVNAQSVVAEHTLTFTVSAYDSGCAPPTLSATGLPAGVTYVTSNQYPSSLNGYITFTWTPTAGQVGTWPIRVMATDTEPNTTTRIVRIYVAGAGESTNSSGVPVSQTNWNVIITNINMSGNNAQVVWTSNEGLTYDVYSSAGSLGGSITWSRLTNGYEATASLSSSDFETPETRRYFKVVPENEGVRDTFGIWGVFRPVISNGFNLVAVPVNYPSRSFSGALGALMASVLEGNDDGLGGSGDEVLIMNDNGSSYRSLWLNSSGEWTVSGGGSDTLAPGQGFFVLRRAASTVYPTFTGPVGTPGSQIAEIVPGWNLLGLAEGWYNVTFSSVFGSPVSGALNSGWDGDDTADEIQVLNANGSYTRYYYAPDGNWYNAQNDAVSGSTPFLPGRAYYFKRDSGSLEVRF